MENIRIIFSIIGGLGLSLIIITILFMRLRVAQKKITLLAKSTETIKQEYLLFKILTTQDGSYATRIVINGLKENPLQTINSLRSKIISYYCARIRQWDAYSIESFINKLKTELEDDVEKNNLLISLLRTALAKTSVERLAIIFVGGIKEAIQNQAHTATTTRGLIIQVVKTANNMELFCARFDEEINALLRDEPFNQEQRGLIEVECSYVHDWL